MNPQPLERGGVGTLLVVGGSIVVGASYVLYLRFEPFPPAFPRVVPAAWLAGAIAGCVAALRSLRGSGSRRAAGVTLVLGIPSAVVAGLFTMAALIGD